MCKNNWGRCWAGAGQGRLCVSIPDVDGAIQVDATGSKLLSIEGKNILVSETISCFIWLAQGDSPESGSAADLLSQWKSPEMTFVLSGIWPTSCSQCPQSRSRLRTDTHPWGTQDQARPFPCRRSPYLKYPEVQTDVCSRGTDAWFDLSLSVGKVMFINLSKRQSQLHLVHKWTSEKAKRPRKDKPTWAWLNRWMLACHWVLACHTSLRPLQSIQSLGSRGRKRFLLLSLEISVPGAFSYPTARQHQLHHSLFCHFVTPPHRNALPDSL